MKTNISSINQTLNTNSTDIVELETKHNQQQSEINNLTTQLETKQDNLNDNSKDIKPKKIDLGDNINLFKYSNNELVINYNHKLSFIDRNNKRLTFLDGAISNYQQSYNIETKNRNEGLTNFYSSGKTFNNKPIYEGVIEFEASGEANLVNECTVLLGAYLYNITDNRFIDVATVNLRVFNNFQIRGSFPPDNKRYRLYFMGVN